MPTKTDTSNSGDDDGEFEFDPENPPKRWTRKMFARLSIGEIRRLRKPGNGILSPESQASFDEVFAAWDEDLNARLKPAAVLMAAISSPAPGTAVTLLQELLFQSKQNLEDRLTVSKSLDAGIPLPEQEQEPPADEPTPHITIESTAGEFEQGTFEELDHFAVLQSINRLLMGQDRAAARGSFFYGAVGIATALAGFATLVTMNTWTERLWTIGLTVALGVIALVVAGIVKWRQDRNPLRSLLGSRSFSLSSPPQSDG